MGMRAAQFKVTAQAFLALLQKHGANLPDDARWFRIYYDFDTDSLKLSFRSESLEEVPEGHRIPEYDLILSSDV